MSYAPILRPAISLAGLVSAALVGEYTQPRLARQALPSFRFVNPKRYSHLLIATFHGMQGDETQFDPIVPYLTTQGEVVHTLNGGLVRDTPQTFALSYVIEMQKNLRGPGPVIPVGLSLGTNTAVRCLRLLLMGDTHVPGIILMMGPATPDDVIWPSRTIHLATHLLAGGPISVLVWRWMNHREAKAIVARFASGEMGKLDAVTALREIERVRSIPAANIANSAALLREGPQLKPGEFPTPALIIQRPGDTLVRPCLDKWLAAFPNKKSRTAMLSTPGHAVLGECRDELVAVIENWMTEIRQSFGSPS